MRWPASLLLLLIVAVGYAQPEKKSKQIERLLSKYSELEQLNGSVLVADHGKAMFEHAYGKADVSWDIDNTIDTRFKVASVSKVFTAVLTFMLCQEQKLTLNDKVSMYLPNFKNGSRITIEQLLSHASGIIDHRNMREVYDNQYGMSNLTRNQMIDLFADSVLRFEPGSAWRYSNFGYNLMAVIIEKVTGKAFSDVLAEKIFIPLNMQSTTTMEDRRVIPKLATGYEQTWGGLETAQYYDGSMMAGAGSIISTTRDLLVFFRALRKGSLLNDTYQAKFFETRFIDENGSEAGYSTWYFNQPTGDGDSTKVMYAAGNHFGTHSLVYDCNEGDRMVIMLLNMKSEKLFEIADNILNILFDQKIVEPRDSYARHLSKDIKQYGVKKAIERFRSNKLLHKDEWSQRPRDLNRLGYYFMQNNQPQVALEVFKLNLEYFPNESDFFDSLGEAYFILGDKVNAAVNLEKSLELNPNNDHAKELLQKINHN